MKKYVKEVYGLTAHPTEEETLLPVHTGTRIYYVGETADIKALYKSIARHSAECDIFPFFETSPKFNTDKQVYALCVEYSYNSIQYMTVINSDTMLHMIVTGEVKEVC